MGEIKRKIYQMSLKKSLILIFTVFVIVIVVLSGVTILAAVNAQRDILDSRSILFKTTDIEPSSDGSLSYQIGDEFEWEPLTTKQQFIYYGSVAAMVVLPVLYVVAGIIAAATVYYRLKLRKPLYDLNNGIQNITNNDLDFVLDYECQDELGKLCAAMETMRMELIQNNKRIWKLLEERKALNASISHDLGTPITVIKGYLDFLQKKVPQKEITENELMDTLAYMSEATGRLEHYINGVRDVQKLEDINVCPKVEQFSAVFQEFESNFASLSQRKQKIIKLTESCGNRNVKVDKQILFRIVENITDNALRYAKDLVKVDFSCREELLYICIEDDGSGFTQKALESADSLFYMTEDKDYHFGLGLSISKVLCEKHGGSLQISNNEQRGGRVLITIKIK